MKTEDDEMPSHSALMRKLTFQQQECSDSGGNQSVTQQWLVHVARLNELIGGLICPNCAGTGLKVNIDPNNQGFCSSLLLECSPC